MDVARQTHPRPSRMTQQARAAVIVRKDGPFVMQDVTLETPRPDEALVRMVATGICAADRRLRTVENVSEILDRLFDQFGRAKLHVMPGD